MPPAVAQPPTLTERRQTPATGRVQNFLASQRGLASFYAAEGKQIAAAWSNPDAGDSLPQSPILVPRAAAAMGNESRATSHISPSDKHEILSNQASHSAAEQLPDTKRVSHSKTASLGRIKSRNSGSAQLRTEDRDLILDNESERTKRLAQRRNCRRARRATMNAVDEDTTSEIASSQGDTRQPKQKRQKVAPKSKSKKDKVAPALLLMQTFSGQKMSKSRLTMKPSASIGVFNKGKASAKVKTKSGRAVKLRPDIAFSESAFLNKASPVRPEENTLTDDSDDSEAHSDHSIAERAKSHNTKGTSQSAHDGFRRGQTSMDRDDARSEDTSSARSVREVSPSWDVEEQVEQLHNLEVARTRSPSVTRPPKPKTAVIGVNQCSWSSKLRKPELHIIASEDAPTLPLPPKPSEKHHTTSSYFSLPQVSVEPPIALSPPSYGETNPLTSISPKEITRSPYSHADYLDSFDSLSCGVALSSPDISHGYMHAPRASVSACFSPMNSMEIPLDVELVETNPMCMDGEYEEWELEVPSLPEPLLFDDNVQDDEYILSVDDNQGPLDWDGVDLDYNHVVEEPYASFHDQEVAEYQAYDGGDDICELSYLQVDEGFDREDVRGSFHDGHEEGIEYISEEMLDNTGVDEQALCWATGEDDDFDGELDLLPDRPEFEDPASLDEDDNTVLEDQAEEPTPSLVQIITEASLENDLLKSIGNHWGTAHRLY
ncbi:hypothetical protein FRC07_004001 [Ceratobasidium sp. 392]|nr:hypothetical protein FRC07_004001 [Ceratobasidium sp. 392]